jgi:hypothetical protein
MFKTNQTLTNERKQYLTNISPDGIWKGLKLIDIKFNDEKEELEFELLQLSTNATHVQRFKAPVTGADVNPMRTELQIADIEHMFGAFVPSNYNPESRRDEKWGSEGIQADTFKEFCQWYISKVNIEKAPIVDMKQLYSKDVVICKPGEIRSPYKVTGSRPFITSEYAPAALNVGYDTDDKRGNWKRYLDFTVEYMVEVESDIPLPRAASTDALPF